MLLSVLFSNVHFKGYSTIVPEAADSKLYFITPAIFQARFSIQNLKVQIGRIMNRLDLIVRSVCPTMEDMVGRLDHVERSWPLPVNIVRSNF